MTPNSKFTGENLEFWSNIKFISQKIGYYKKPTPNHPLRGFCVPDADQIKSTFLAEKLDYSKLVDPKGALTTYGQKVVDYFTYRRDVLNTEVEPNLMDAKQAKRLFSKHKARLNPKCPLPYNKQTGSKKDFAFLTCLVNMLIEEHIEGQSCDYDPRQLTAITVDGYPVRTLSRRVDGAFPSAINPISVWEIKEYYYTTTFGSRIADGVYETMLDGYEVEEIRQNLDIDVKHYLFIDAYPTWWEDGKSYLCRMVDILNMGLVREIIIGKEVEVRLPALAKEWLDELKKRNTGAVSQNKP